MRLSEGGLDGGFLLDLDLDDFADLIAGGEELAQRIERATKGK